MSAMSYRPCKECFWHEFEHSRPSNHGLKFLGLYRKLAPKCPPWAIDHARSVLARIPSILDHQITVWSFWVYTGNWRQMSAMSYRPCRECFGTNSEHSRPSNHGFEVFGSIPEIGAKMSAMSYRPSGSVLGRIPSILDHQSRFEVFGSIPGNWRQNVRHEL